MLLTYGTFNGSQKYIELILQVFLYCQPVGGHNRSPADSDMENTAEICEVIFVINEKYWNKRHYSNYV